MVTFGGLIDVDNGYGHSMTTHPQTGPDEVDRDKESTPAGVAEDLEELAEESGAVAGPPEDDAEAEVDARGVQVGPNEVEGPNSL